VGTEKAQKEFFANYFFFERDQQKDRTDGRNPEDFSGEKKLLHSTVGIKAKLNRTLLPERVREGG